MIVKDVASQGYPFVEAIRSALPICDEFLVSDGCSTDETWPVLEVLQKKYPEKLKLFRDCWDNPATRGPNLAFMTNVLKPRCLGRYCFNLQANEILHERSLEDIKRLPRHYPSAELFRLPFHNIIGSNILWMTDFRKRLFKNVPYVASLGDAYDVGYKLSEFMTRPRKLLRHFIHRGIGEQVCYLSKPVYRYRSLFPEHYLAKLDRLRNREYAWKEEYESAVKEYKFAMGVWNEISATGCEPDDFWERMRPYYEHVIFEDLPPGGAVPDWVPRGCCGTLGDAPRVVAHLIGKWRYNVEESLLALETDDVTPDHEKA